jgi:hypothetical protein
VRWEGGNEISSSKNLVSDHICLLRNKFVLFSFDLPKCGIPCGVLGVEGGYRLESRRLWLYGLFGVWANGGYML